jgi:hypothetical protein
MIKNVLPFFLDGGIQEVSGGTFWDGTSSFIESTANASIIVDVKSPSGRPVKPGTILVVTNRGGTSVGIAPLADFSANDNNISINDLGASVLLMFKGPSAVNKLGEWVVLSKFNADTDTVFTGGAVANPTTFQANVTVGNSDTDVFKVQSEILVTGSAPTIAVTAAGNGTATLSAESTDAAGIITFADTWASADTATVTFNNAFDRTPVVVASENATATRNFSVSDTTSSSFTITCSGTMVGDVSYIVLGLE